MKLGITYTLEVEQDDTPIEGNASAWGDGTDEPYWAEIRGRLDRGDVWAWCVVTVTAEVTIDGETFRGSAAIGGCCYADEADFRRGGYCADLETEAFDDLIRNVGAANMRGLVARRALRALIKVAG